MWTVMKYAVFSTVKKMYFINKGLAVKNLCLSFVLLYEV